MQIEVSPQEPPERLDLYLSRCIEDISRAQIQRLIKADAILLNDQPVLASYKIQPGDRILVDPPEPEPAKANAEELPLTVAYEDADLIVVDKAAGMAVHPAPGVRQGTLVNALLHHCQDLSGINGVLRPGIVHRIDKETSGLLIVAKHDVAHRHLAAQLQAHDIERTYTALVWGNIKQDVGRIEAPIDRNPRNRKKMAIVEGGKEAATNFTVVQRFPYLTLLDLRLETGRTHQIRVHMLHHGHPIFGDPVYGGRSQTQGIKPDYRRHAKYLLSLIKRQALHARRLGFEHPRTGENMEFSSALPADLAAVVAAAYPEE
jgi:23S rRNA pseudouridine1911/1915/1917 synthase